jgi:tetratricopeptide (TPR) repeat protein
LGKEKEAEELYFEVVTKEKEVLGVDHPDTLSSMYNLGNTYSKLGKEKEAEELYFEVVKKRKQILGVDHTDTLWSIYNLAVTYGKLKKWKEAEELDMEVVKRRKQVLGVDHPDTLTSMYKLVLTYKGLGKKKDAQALSKTIEDIHKVCWNFYRQCNTINPCSITESPGLHFVRSFGAVSGTSFSPSTVGSFRFLVSVYVPCIIESQYL